MKSTKITLGIIVFIVFCIGAGLIIAHHSKDASTADSSAASTSATADATASGAASSDNSAASNFTDGTYTATGTYQSPAGPEGVKVTVTLKNDVITDSTVTSEATDGESKHYQAMFISGYRTYVNGKNIADVNVGKVSGSSLTGTGFNNALIQIMQEAKA